MSIHEPTGIHWIDHGSGPAIIVLHGFQVDYRLVHRFVESIFKVRPGFRRIYVDLPAHGKSSGHDITSTDDVVARISAFIDDVMGTEPYALVGNSFGGGIARALTSLAPSRILGMALIAPMIVADSARRVLPEHQVLEADDVFLATIESGTARADFEEIAVRQNRKTWEFFASDVLPGASLGDHDAIRRIAASYEFSTRPEGRFETYDRPVAFILGRQDSVVGYADALSLANSYPHATFAVLDGAGHNVHHEQPELAARVLGEWADRVLAAM